MLKVMKDKAKQLNDSKDMKPEEVRVGGIEKRMDGPGVEVGVDVELKVEEKIMGGPTYLAVVKKLSLLKPSELTIEDETYKHAGTAN